MNRAKQWETLTAILSGLIVLYWFKRYDGLLIAGAAIGIVSLLIPAVGGTIHWGWTKLSHLLGEVSGRVLLTVVYFIVLLPLSILARAAGKSGVRMRPGGDSYFKTRDHTYTKEDLMHPW